MQKEVIIAIIFGSLLGVLVAFGVWRANTALRQNKLEATNNQQQNTNNNEVKQEPENDSDISLTIQRPENGYAFGEDSATLSGLVNGEALVAISSEKNDTILIPSDKEFEYDVSLLGGINDIFIYAFDENNIADNNLALVYSSKLDIGDVNNDNIDDLIEKRKELASNPFVFYLGTITDITENSMQIQTSDGIKQVSLSQATSYANVTDGSREVEFADLAIGDYIIAIGRVDKDDILECERVLVSEKYQQSSRKAVIGTVSDITSKEITIKDKDDTEYAINLINATDYYQKTDNEIDDIKRSDIDEEAKVFVIYTEDKGKLTARLVYLY
jgi:hypothetical protein